MLSSQPGELISKGGLDEEMKSDRAHELKLNCKLSGAILQHTRALWALLQRKKTFECVVNIASIDVSVMRCMVSC